MSKGDVLTTVTGLEITYPVSFRLPMSLYQELMIKAKSEGCTLSSLVSKWVTEKLGGEFESGDYSQRFTQEEDDIIKANNNKSALEISKSLLPHRSVSGISRRACILSVKLKRSSRGDA